MSFRSYGSERRESLARRHDAPVASRSARVRTRPAPSGTTGDARALTGILLSALVLIVLFASIGTARAAGSAVPLEQPRIDQGNEKSLQRGAAHFVNNCMGCHSAGYNRYSRVAADLGLSEEDVERNLIFTTDVDGEPTKVGALMTNNMTKEYGQQAFGIKPPDLSLTARSRGTDWIYTFLQTFYLDDDRQTGVNNLVYPGTAMPHVLWNYQGFQVLEEGAVDEEHAEDGHAAPQLVLAEAGSLSPEEYDDMIADITNFLAYMANPIKETSHRVGILVMLFLLGLLVVAYFLKKEYWKNVV